MRKSDEKLYFNEKERGNVWKDYVERIMNDENDCDHNVAGDALESLVVCVSREEVFQVFNLMKSGKDFGSSKVSLWLIAASGRV